MAQSNSTPDRCALPIDFLHTHICLLSADARITHINENCRRHFAAADVVGQSFTALLPTSEHELFWRELKRLTPLQPTLHFEHTFSESNGTIRTEAWDIKACHDGGGQVVSYLCEGRDISQHKMDQQLLWQSEKKLRMIEASSGTDRGALLNTICQAMQDAIIIMDHAGAVRFWGGGAEKIFGYSEEEIVGKDMHSILAPERYREKAREAFARYRETGLGAILNKVVETEAIRKDGTEISMELFLSPIKIDNQWCALGLMRDIGERHKAAAAVRQNLENIEASRKFLQRIINLLPVRVFWKDRQLCYMGCNDLFAHDAGQRDSQEMIGKDDFDMTWKDQADLYRSDDFDVMNSGKEKLNIEEPQTTPDGETIYLSTSKVPLIDDDGQVLGILGMYDDITVRKKAEDRTKSLLHELQQFQDLAIDRENEMIDLKKQVNTLCRELGRPEPYDLSFLGGIDD